MNDVTISLKAAEAAIFETAHAYGGPLPNGLINSITLALSKLPAAEAPLKAAIEPVLDWYQGDEMPERDLAAILSDIVADLQLDRQTNLALRARVAELEGERELRPMATAPTNKREFILVKVKDDAWPKGDRHEYYSGRWFVPFHEGTTDSGYDLGWGLFPGFGGVPSHMFEGWMPLPKEPTP